MEREEWFAAYHYRGGSVRASRNVEPTKKRPTGHYYTFDSRKEAEEYYVERLEAHTKNIIYTIKSLSTNAALRKRLKKYEADDSVEALRTVEHILRTIPNFVQ
jgi:hypothetical protein